MYDRKPRPLQPWPHFLRRLALTSGIAMGILAMSLGIGIVGYHVVAGLNWIDSLLNASMILTGMGPVTPMTDSASKIFASCYAIFSGVIFLSSVGIVLSPLVHRILHRFHLEDDRQQSE